MANGHNFFEAITQFFGKSRLLEQKEDGNKQPSLPEMENDVVLAIQQLNSKIEQLQREKNERAAGDVLPVESLAQERERRMQKEHAAILKDILSMHHQLKTGIDASALDGLVQFLAECMKKVDMGPSLQGVMPCCRMGVLRRFHHEAGSVAWAELEASMQDAKESWPEMAQRDPVEDAAAFERRQQHKFQDMRNDFINYDLARSHGLIRGIERAWQSNYPEQGTPLWRELVLEGVATALRARILHRYYDRLLANKEKIVGRVAELVGHELGTLQAVLAEKNLTSLEDAHRVATASSRVLEEVIPEIAWQVIKDEKR